MNVATTYAQYLSLRSDDGESELWHKRLGHLNYRSLENLSTKNLVHGIPKIVAPEKSCDICMRGKQPRFPFSSEISPRETQALGVVHYDVHGLLRNLQLEGTSTLCHLCISSQE